MTLPYDWLAEKAGAPSEHITILVEEGCREDAIPILVDAVVDHLTDADRLTRLGRGVLAASVRAKLPQSIRTRSGDLCEIIATEYIEHHSDFSIPIKRLRWKDGREVSMRGDDLIALNWRDGTFTIMKGETKSRRRLSDTTVEEALAQLDRDGGRPQAHSLAFIADRLDELDREEEALFVYDLLTNNLPRDRIQHLLFTMSGNEPGAYLGAVGERQIKLQLIGLHIEDHQEFIVSVFEACNVAFG